MPLYWDNPHHFWDSGITWDAGDSPNPGDVTPYLNLITSRHRQKPKFIAMLTGVFQPLADGLAVSESLNTLFDIDDAEGVQLDAIGVWVGRSRNLSVPLANVYFQFDTGPGFDIGVLRGPFDPLDTLLVLPDDQYRTLLYATIAANHWDGTIPGAYNAYAVLFGPRGFSMLIIDNQDMTMDVVLGGPIPDAVTLALLLGGYLSLKPMGVRISNYIVSANSAAKIFMFDASPDSPIVGGFDTAAFPSFYTGA